MRLGTASGVPGLEGAAKRRYREPGRSRPDALRKFREPRLGPGRTDLQELRGIQDLVVTTTKPTGAPAFSGGYRLAAVIPSGSQAMLRRRFH